MNATASTTPNNSLTVTEFSSNSSVGLRDLFAIIEYHAPYAMPINKYITPVFYIVGFVGNIISALFWSSQRIRTCNTAAVYLTSLAVADFSYLALHVFYELENPWLVHTLNVDGWCQLWNGLYMAAQYFCVFLVCAFTIERFLSVCHPFKSERFGRTRSPRIILVLLLVSLVLGSPQAYFWTVAGTSDCHVRVVQLYNASFYSIWSWCTDMMIFGALPVLVLVLNICVLKKIRHAGKLRLSDSPLSHSSGSAHYTRVSGSGGKQGSRANSAYGTSQGGKDSSSTGGSLISNGTTSYTSGGSHNFTATTVTLLWVSFYLIFTTLPVTIVFAIQTAIPLGDPMPLPDMANDPAWQRYITYFAARVIIREIGMSHHVGNVFIYLATSQRFRRQLKKRMTKGAAAPSTPGTETEMTTLHSTHHHHLKTLKSNNCG